jgi:hypothetical protein
MGSEKTQSRGENTNDIRERFRIQCGINSNNTRIGTQSLVRQVPEELFKQRAKYVLPFIYHT